mgnify:CR=1 FL=1
MRPDKIDTRELVQRIEKLTRERMTEPNVISISDIRRLKKTTPSLLIIEDDETIRSALRRLFEGAGYRVRPASD